MDGVSVATLKRYFFSFPLVGYEPRTFMFLFALKHSTVEPQ
jgi:hypothetical protein